MKDKPTLPNLTGYAKLTDIPDITVKADKTYVDTKLNNYVKKAEAFSGSYNDLTDKPDIANLATKTYVNDEIAKVSTGSVDLTGYAKTADIDTKLNNYVKKNEAFSGSYNDLKDKPTIPNVSNLAAKADLTNHTDDATIHVTSTEKSKWNAVSNKADKSHTHTKSQITDMPTKLSQFSNDAGFITSADVDTSKNHTHSNKAVLDGITSDLITKWNGYNDTINTMKTNFEDGVNTIYNAVVAKGVTPLDKSPSSIVDAIEKLVLMISNPLLTYTFETGSPIMPLLNGISTYNNYFIDTDNGDGTTTRKLYVVKEVNRISFEKRSSTSSIISLDNTASIKLTSTNNMFSGCDKLRFINLSNLDTSNVTDMSGMFNNCKSLTSLYMSNFDTSKVTSMGSMFAHCNSLTSLDVSDFDTSRVTSMRYMFSNCTSLATLDIRSFSSESLEDSNGMIYYVPSNCKVYVDKTKFTKTEADCNFNGTFTDVSQQG